MEAKQCSLASPADIGSCNYSRALDTWKHLPVCGKLVQVLETQTLTLTLTNSSGSWYNGSKISRSVTKPTTQSKQYGLLEIQSIHYCMSFKVIPQIWTSLHADNCADQCNNYGMLCYCSLLSLLLGSPVVLSFIGAGTYQQVLATCIDWHTLDSTK
jgi:hypothetical protein